MLDFSWSQVFKSTTRGTANLKNFPAVMYLSKSFYICSLILQCILILVFLLYLVLSFFRVLKRIKNGKFGKIKDPYESRNKRKKSGKTKETTKRQGNDSDESDESEEAEFQRDNKVMDVNGGKRNEEQQFDDYHDENEQNFIKLDQQILSLVPYLIPFIISNNLFSADFISICLISLTIASYFLFNIKGKLIQIKPLQYIYILFSLLGYFSFFYNDQDPTT